MYLSDGKFSVKTEPAVLTVSFLINPRLEDGIITVPDFAVTSDGMGNFNVDFSSLVPRLSEHKVVKVVAQSTGKAQSGYCTSSFVG